MYPKDVDEMTNSIDTEEAVWSGSTLLAQTCLLENLGSLQYYSISDI